MNLTGPFKIDRRCFLKGSAAAAGGLALGVVRPGAMAQFGGGSDSITPEAFIHVGTDGLVTLTIHKPENGQGTETSIAMLLAEELECDWSSIQTVFAPVDPVYGGPLQGTFGSMAIRSSWEPMRRTGAAARQMLVQAAAQRWGVDSGRCYAENGTVINRDTGARLGFGTVTEAASNLPVPEEISLKSPDAFRLLGRSVARLDTPAKARAEAVYGIDMHMPGMVYAVVARPPVSGGSLASFDAARARAVPGVLDVFEIPQGVAVTAENTWAALQGRRLLDIQWNDGPNADVSSDGIRRQFMALIDTPGVVARQAGDMESAMAGASQRLEAVYEAPYLAHAPMEPFSALAVVGPDSCEVWTGAQIPGLSHLSAVQASGLPPDRVKIHTLYMGGGFGARGGGPWVAEAVHIAKTAGVPVKLTWSREDDLQHDRYRPASCVRLEAGLDEAGLPVAWGGRVTCSTFMGLDENGLDREAVVDLAEPNYAIDNVHFEYHEPGLDIPTNYWRSVGHSQNTFYAESFIDELAVAAGADPVAYRRRLLAHQPRLLGVLDVAAAGIDWDVGPPEGRYRGVAVANCFGSYNAQIAEISIEQGVPRVHRVVCAIDCGFVVNPAGVEKQMHSGIVYGLSAALRGNITLERGRVQQVNFHQYEPLRMDEMPAVEVHIVSSDASPGGIGEVGTPCIAPAVTNALFRATGRRIRRLPISEHEPVVGS